MDSVVSFGLPDKKQSVVTIGIFPFHIQPDHSEGLTLMVNTGLSRGALSFRKKKEVTQDHKKDNTSAVSS